LYRTGLAGSLRFGRSRQQHGDEGGDLFRRRVTAYHPEQRPAGRL